MDGPSNGALQSPTIMVHRRPRNEFRARLSGFRLSRTLIIITTTTAACTSVREIRKGRVTQVLTPRAPIGVAERLNANRTTAFRPMSDSHAQRIRKLLAVDETQVPVDWLEMHVRGRVRKSFAANETRRRYFRGEIPRDRRVQGNTEEVERDGSSGHVSTYYCKRYRDEAPAIPAININISPLGRLRHATEEPIIMHRAVKSGITPSGKVPQKKRWETGRFVLTAIYYGATVQRLDGEISDSNSWPVTNRGH